MVSDNRRGAALLHSPEHQPEYGFSDQFIPLEIHFVGAPPGACHPEKACSDPTANRISWITAAENQWFASAESDEPFGVGNLIMGTNLTDLPQRGKFVFLFVIAAALLLPSLVGCRSTSVSPPTRYVLATTLAKHKIQASLDRPATIESHDDHALIAFAHHRLRVEVGRVVLDNNVTAAFPMTATQIAIEVEGGTIRVTADGQEMWKQPLPND